MVSMVTKWLLALMWNNVFATVEVVGREIFWRLKSFSLLTLQDVTRGIDTSLTLKLQKRLTELEQEKQSLRNELENKEEQFQRARARVLTSSLKLYYTQHYRPCSRRLLI